MNKKIFIISILISLLISLPLISISTANGGDGGTESWTGVEEKIYKWNTLTVNNASLQELYTDLNFSEIAPSWFTRDVISNMSTSQIELSMNVYNITTDLESEYSVYNWNVTKIDANGTMTRNGIPFGPSEPQPTSTELQNMTDTTNLDFWIGFVPFTTGSSHLYTIPLSANMVFVSTNLNWTYHNQGYNETLKNNLTYGKDFTLSTLENGLNLWYNKSVLNQYYSPSFSDPNDFVINQTKELELSLEIDDKGILSVLEVKYGGKVAIAWARVDMTPPSITIISPTANQVINITNGGPPFEVEISDPNLDKMWYTLHDGWNITFTSNTTINSEKWGMLPDGNVTITFYANDTSGNLASSSVKVIKDTSGDGGEEDGEQIPGYELLSLVGISTATIIGLIYLLKRKTLQ